MARWPKPPRALVTTQGERLGWGEVALQFSQQMSSSSCRACGGWRGMMEAGQGCCINERSWNYIGLLHLSLLPPTHLWVFYSLKSLCLLCLCLLWRVELGDLEFRCPVIGVGPVDQHEHAGPRVAVKGLCGRTVAVLGLRYLSRPSSQALPSAWPGHPPASSAVSLLTM